MADFETSDPSGPPPTRGASASERLSQVSFPLAVRGYERAAVDAFVNEVRALVAELEANQTREGAVHKALDEVGIETASILQRAHAAAEELASRSRVDAEERLQRADLEADQVRREADEYANQVVVDTRLLWEQRQRLIEDIRQLADVVLATADDAMERLRLPEPPADDATDPEPTTDEAPAPGPVEVPPPEPEEPPLEDTAAWGVGEVEAEPADGETGVYTPSGPPYDLGESDHESLYAETAPYRIGAEADEPPPEDEPGHTVELEALPGGADEQPTDEREESWFEPEGGGDRERD